MTASALLDGGPVARTERAYPALDGLRLVAATAVVFTHTGFATGYSVADLGPLVGAGLARLVRARPERPRGVLIALGSAVVAGAVWTAYTAGTGATALPYRLWLPEYAGWFATGIALALFTVVDPSWGPARVAR